MKNGFTKYLLFIFIWVLSGCGGHYVDWTPTFDSKHKSPYGTYILRNELRNLFPKSSITNIDINTYEYFESKELEFLSDNYIVIHSGYLYEDSVWEKILQFVNSGGHAFVSSGVRIPTFNQYLGIEIDYINYTPFDSKRVQLSVSDLNKESSFEFPIEFDEIYFGSFDTETTEVLGYISYKGEKYPNFIKVYHGKGYFLIHTQPYVFTNHYMLNKNSPEYVESLFSYLPNEDILWDNHNINNRGFDSEYDDGGFFATLSFMLKHQSLRWALSLLVVMGILYLLINSKRKQRAMRIIKPYSNYSISFGQTLSELYKNNADHTALVKYKINYFLEQIRIHYNISSKDTEKDFSELLSAKSGVNLDLCNKLALHIDIFRSKNYLDKEDFFKLQSLIESFNQKSGLYGRKGRK